MYVICYSLKTNFIRKFFNDNLIIEYLLTISSLLLQLLYGKICKEGGA